jgi:glycosyltransferase involved in cell wall biosynthesis
MDAPTVSIGLPVYNGERFLESALESLLAQTFEDFEVIISDNASTDRTHEICQKYAAADSRIKVARNGRNIGIVRNFNQTFHLARGKYFKWAAHDDALAPTYLVKCVEALDADPDVVLVSPRVGLIGSDGEPLPYDEQLGAHMTDYGELIRPPVESREYDHDAVVERFRHVVLFLSGSLLNAHTYGLTRADSLARTTLHAGYVGSEKIVLAHLALLGKIHELPEVLFFWRQHPDHVANDAVRTVADMTRHMDPTWGGRIPFMHLKQINGYRRAIAASPLSAREKMACRLVILEKLARVAARRARRAVSRS